MKVLVSGASGLVGSALAPSLTGAGHTVRRLVRSEPSGESEFRWDPDSGGLDPAALDGVDAVVHLAGETIAGRWTAAKKERILKSREQGTSLLSEALARLERPPSALVCASGVDYYGDRGTEELTEESSPDGGFLAEVVKRWEAASEPAARAGIRVVPLRFGIVLSRDGGALRAMLVPFRLGLGGKFGNGRQYMSWIAIDDLVRVIERAIEDERLSGPVNAVAPGPVTNEEFTRTLGRVLRRPALFRVPGFALRLALGQFAVEGLLTGQRVVPARLRRVGHEFAHPELEEALRHVLGR
jgi:uncharacterized protein (TIGR01777 family)